jgi:hypothetical protein
VFKKLSSKTETEFFGPWGPVASAKTTFPLACTDTTPKPLRDLLCPDPWSILEYPKPSSPTASAFETALRSSDPHRVEWAESTLPGAACGSTNPIRLHRGTADVRSQTYPWWAVVDAYLGPVSYGDVNGDGRDEAAVGVSCSNGGGTAAGQLAFADVVLRSDRKVLRPLGIITPRQPYDPNAGHVPVLGSARAKRWVTIRSGEVIAHEGWYGRRDGTCCPSGRARTVWRYTKGTLRPLRTVVERQPAGR